MATTESYSSPTPAEQTMSQLEMDLPGADVAAQPEGRPIDRLAPGTELHNKVLQKLKDRLSMSERKMGSFYARWQMSEKRMQAHIDLPQYERMLKELAKAENAPAPLVSITVPYSFATIWTIVTYLAHTFTGRKPIFQVGTHQGEGVNAAEHMETVLQYNADHIRLVRHLFQWFLDGEMYGIGIIRTVWAQERKYRTVVGEASALGSLAPDAPMTRQRFREKRVVYEGNDCKSIDPFMFFPDPRVPMVEVNKRGEFVFWRTFEGEHTLRKAESDGLLKWVAAAKKTLPTGENTNGGTESSRNLLASGDAHAGGGVRGGQDEKALPFFQVDQGSVEIVPSLWGLSDSDETEKWMFTILNKNQIVQVEPLDLDHDMHPVSIIEPYSIGYGFGQMSMNDMLGPLQDTVSWFVNSHMHNVRNTIYNEFIVNPAAVEMQDLKDPKPGKIIRLKPSAYGTDVRTVIQQLQTVDATRGHVGDMQEFIRMADSISAVNDNLRGIQMAGGRKTATEVRTSGEAGGSRLAAHARLISAQGVTDLTEQMSLNLQQNLSMEFFLQVVGQDGLTSPLKITPESIVGDFYYPIHDGTLPLDKVALLDIWKEIMMGVMQDPELRAGYSVGKIFEFVAEMGGAKNITSFRVQPEEQMQQQLQAGNALPVPGIGGMGPGGQMDPALLAAALGGA